MGDKRSTKAGPDPDGVPRQASHAGQAGQERQDAQNEARKIEVGMAIQADLGDLGQEDISEAKVTGVVHDPAGDVETIVARKGTVFRKELNIAVERVQSVEENAAADRSDPSSSKVVISASEKEVDELKAVGSEALPAEEPAPDGTPETGEQGASGEGDGGTGDVAGHHAKVSLVKMLGPGFMSGMAGNDASAVAAYSLDGAQNGYGHLWLILLSTPLLQAVQFACAKIGRVQQKGLAEILREQYGRKVAVPASLLLIVANLALIAADLVAISAGLELITGVRWIWFAAPVAIALWYVTVYRTFEAIKKIFLAMSTVFVAYIFTAFFSKPDWGAALRNTVIPHVDFGFASISTAVALLGATISPYTIFWQVQGEKEEKRSGSTRSKFRYASIDIAVGVISGNLVAYFIIVSTAATLFTNHLQIHTALDAARALEPLVGPFAKYLFALGLIGAGLLAIPVLLASASYGVAGTIGWPAGLSKKPWQNEGFYLILSVGLAVSLAIALIGLDPVHLMFWANVLQGVLSPSLVVLLVVIGNSDAIMGKNRLGLATSAGLVIAAIVMFAASALLFYQLVAGLFGR